MDFEVRHADVEDGEDLLELWHGFTDHLSTYDDRYRHKDSADDRWLKYFENQLVDSKYGTVIVAEHDGEVVGVLEARIMGNHPIFQLENHGYVNGHFVREPFREEGVGEALVEAAGEWFTEEPRGVDFYRVDVVEGDDRAASLYEDLGFDTVEHVYERQVE